LRIDKYLQVSRLVKRRASAKEACDAGRVCINGRPAKPGSEVRVGDEVSLTWGRKTTEVQVLAVPDRSVPAARAKTLYQVLREFGAAPSRLLPHEAQSQAPSKGDATEFDEDVE
jgi:ribosomal 50S subunit-recycling heat shock protein